MHRQEEQRLERVQRALAIQRVAILRHPAARFAQAFKQQVGGAELDKRRGQGAVGGQHAGGQGGGPGAQRPVDAAELRASKRKKAEDL